MYTRFTSDLINNMDHMRISGTEPSSVNFSRKLFKNLKSTAPKVPKQAEAKMNGVITQKFQSILTRKNFDALKRYESTEVDRKTFRYSYFDYCIRRNIRCVLISAIYVVLSWTRI